MKFEIISSGTHRNGWTDEDCEPTVVAETDSLAEAVACAQSPGNWRGLWFEAMQIVEIGNDGTRRQVHVEV